MFSGTEATKMKHEGFTQGPWEDDNSGKYYEGRVIRMNGVVIARMSEPSGNSPSAAEVDANAALIAEIPNLLAENERLRAALKAARGFASKGGSVKGPSKRRNVDYSVLGAMGADAKKCRVDILGADDLILPCVLLRAHEGFHSTGR